jgi:hypothetical protein
MPTPMTDEELADVLAGAIDPADPDAAEKARLLAEILLGGEGDSPPPPRLTPPPPPR